jgi:hypothetical protein
MVATLTIFNFYENTKGTLKFTILFFSHLILFQVISIILNISLSYIFPVMQMNTVKSLIPLGIAFLIQNIIFSNFKHLNLIKNNEINNRFLLIFLFVGMILFNFNSTLDTLLSISYGVFLCKYKELFVMNDERLLFIEKHENFKSVSNMEGIYGLIKGFINLEENMFRRVNTPINQVNVSTRKSETKVAKEENKQGEGQSILIINYRP